MTIQALIAAQDAAIRNQTTANSITKGNVTDVLTADTNELLARGKTRVTTTANLATLAGDNYQFADVDGYGMFYYSASGTPNGTTIFAALTTGVWVLYSWTPSTGATAVNSVSNSDSSLTISPTTGAVVASLNVANSNIFTAAQTVKKTSLGTTYVTAINLLNDTAAAAGAQQVSPALRFDARGWKTNATAASQQVTWDIYCLPVQGAANPSATLQFIPRINNSAVFPSLVMASNGSLTINGDNTSGSGLIVASGMVGIAANSDSATMLTIGNAGNLTGVTAWIKTTGNCRSTAGFTLFDGTVSMNNVQAPAGGTNYIGVSSIVNTNGGLNTSAPAACKSVLAKINYGNINASSVVYPLLTAVHANIVLSTSVAKDATLVYGVLAELIAGDANPTGKAVTYVAFKAEDIDPDCVRTNPYGFWQAGTVLLNRLDNCTSIGTNAKPNGANWLELGTGTTTIAPLKFTAGTNLTTPVNGCMEFDGTHLYITIGGVRITIV